MIIIDFSADFLKEIAAGGACVDTDGDVAHVREY